MSGCLVCEHETTIGRRLDRIPTWLPAEKLEQPRMFEVPKAKQPSAKELYEAARHGDAA